MTNVNRRRAMGAFAGWFAASPLVRAQRDLPYTPERMPTLADIANVFEMEPVFRARVAKHNYDYIAGGVDGEWTLRRNREAFDKILFRPRMLVNTSQMDLSITLFGDKIGMPILLAPMAAHQLAHPDGELATAKAAAANKTIICLSNNSSYPLEKVAEATTAPKWWQLYAREDLDTTRERIERARGAGYKVIVWTVDAPYNSHRERLLRNRVQAEVPVGGAPPAGSAASRRRRVDPDAPTQAHPYRLEPTILNAMDWRSLAQIKTWAKAPVLVKGILTAEDAALAVKHGADGIVVSNHGGRYLEYAPSTIEVLPEIVDAVGGKIPVLIDSGFRRGTDVLKALAIGANAVLIGRPLLWGLGAFGQAGMERVLQMLETELALAMGLSGRANVKALDRSLIRIEK